MPNVIWTSTARAKDGRGAELAAQALRIAQLFKDAGAVDARVWQSNAGPNAPSITVAVEYTGLGHGEEVTAKLATNKEWQALLGDTNPPGTTMAQGLAREVR